MHGEDWLPTARIANRHRGVIALRRPAAFVLPTRVSCRQPGPPPDEPSFSIALRRLLNLCTLLVGRTRIPTRRARSGIYDPPTRRRRE